MKKKKRNNRQNGTSIRNKKASEMIMRIASGYIAMGDSIDKKQSNLNLACTAWNISLLPVGKRINKINDYIDSVRRVNSGISEEDYNGILCNLKILINDKLKYYPNVNRRMLGAKIIIIDGKEHVTVLSIDLDQIRNLTTACS